jgi:hypothetical protein
MVTVASPSRAGGYRTGKENRRTRNRSGELRRYLAEIVLCPPILLNHETLEWNALGPLTLRVHDLRGANRASIDINISAEGRPIACRADRPRVPGKRAFSTPWCAIQLEVSWHLPEGEFSYYRGKITSFVATR